MACTFSTSHLTRVIRTCSVLYILTCKCASRHNGVQLFISHLARWLRTRRFSEPTFRPSASGARNHWKNTVFRDFPTFSRTCIFFLLTLSLLWSFTWAFQLLKNICRFAQSQAFHQIYGRIECFPKKLGVVCHGCVSHRHGPVFSPVTCFQNMEPHIQVSFCLISGSQNYTNSPDSWTCGRLRVSAGVLRIFAGVLRVILGAATCIFICVGARDMRMAWYVFGTQPGCKPCSVIFKMSIVVIVWLLGSKTRQTSRIRRDSV